MSHSTIGSPMHPLDSSAEVDVIGSLHEEASAQDQLVPVTTQDDEPSNDSGFSVYQSPLSPYPLLRSHSNRRINGFSQRSSRSFTVPLSSGGDSIDLQPLRLVATSKWLADPSRRICQYEVPGGGVCRDDHCQDVHLSRMSDNEPSDEETAQYLFSAMPVGSPHALRDIKVALENARSRVAGITFDKRLEEAMATLGLR